jgi:hypothetical protein
MSDDDPTTADKIVADAARALDAIDHQIGQLRAHRFETSEKIAKLLKERKPLARIVTAAHGRRSKTTSQPE